MQYYNPDNNSSRRWAWLAAGLYGALLAAAFLFVSVDASLPIRQADAILVEFEEPKVPDPPVPPRPAVVEPEHTQIDDEESFDQAKGSDEATRTVNPKALFKMAKDGPDEPEDTGNPKVPEGKANTASGTGSGLDAVSGNLDKGLEGRGLVGALPKPDYKANVTRDERRVSRAGIDDEQRHAGGGCQTCGDEGPLYRERQLRAGRYDNLCIQNELTMRNVSSRPPVAVYGRTPFPFGGKALFLLTLCLFLSAGAAAQRRAARIKADSIAATYAGRVQGGAHLHFYETTHDFGDIPRKGGNLVREFEFVNDGTEPLVLLRVLTSCTCTKASFSKRPVAPGERGVVKVIYEPHKKEPGAFSKVIQIFSTSIEGRNVLTVRGNSIDVKKL